MKNNIIIFLLIILISYLIGSFNEKTSYFYNEQKENIINDSMEDYLIGVLACEMPASFNEEALKAQAVASRTYAYYLKSINKNLTNNTDTQCYLTPDEMKQKWNEDYNMYYTKIKNAVNETSNEILKYNGKIVKSYYFALSNGYTENAEFVFNEKEDYLQSVSSLEDINNKNYEQTIIFSKEEFCEKLNIICDNINLQKIERTETNRVDSIVINNKKFKGTEIRKLLGLRSTDFEILVNEEIKIVTHGYGHGVGMSQYGANSLANSGYNYIDILKYYYTGVNISSIKY